MPRYSYLLSAASFLSWQPQFSGPLPWQRPRVPPPGRLRLPGLTAENWVSVNTGKAGNIQHSLVQIKKHFPSPCTPQDVEMSQLCANDGPHLHFTSTFYWFTHLQTPPTKLTFSFTLISQKRTWPIRGRGTTICWISALILYHAPIWEKQPQAPTYLPDLMANQRPQGPLFPTVFQA